MMEQSRVASQSKMKTWHTTWCIPLSRIRDFADVIFAASANSIKRVRGWCICWCKCISVKCTNRQAGRHTYTLYWWQSCNMLKLSKFQHRLHYAPHIQTRSAVHTTPCVCAVSFSATIYFISRFILNYSIQLRISSSIQRSFVLCI